MSNASSNGRGPETPDDWLLSVGIFAASLAAVAVRAAVSYVATQIVARLAARYTTPHTNGSDTKPRTVRHKKG